ncbi:hypothetical protein B0H66DRAFT_482843, partial [Apodospora peruviana]
MGLVHNTQAVSKSHLDIVTEEPGSLVQLPLTLSKTSTPNRLSVSTTSSRSSGRASIWSNYSDQSASSSITTYSQESPASVFAPAVPAKLHTGPKYWCTSCDVGFLRKFDFKRHEGDFHERWKKYVCPEPHCGRAYWGKAVYTTHHKTAHGCSHICRHPDDGLQIIQKRTSWACGFCSALHPSMERHYDHVARHYEDGCTKEHWNHSLVIYGLLHNPLIHECWKVKVAKGDAEHSGRRAIFAWNPKLTGRVPGFMENGPPGKLQDLLEFFQADKTGAEDEARRLADTAYRLA